MPRYTPTATGIAIDEAIRLDEFRARADQQVHAILVAEVITFDIKVDLLQGRTHCAIENERALGEHVEQANGHAGQDSAAHTILQPLIRISGSNPRRCTLRV